MMGTSSSGFLRLFAATVAATDGSGSRMRTCSAWSPRRPATMPNSTRWPGLSSAVPAGRASLCTKTSGPSSRERKPKPFSGLNHLTLPVGTVGSLSRSLPGPARLPGGRRLDAARRTAYLPSRRTPTRIPGGLGSVGLIDHAEPVEKLQEHDREVVVRGLPSHRRPVDLLAQRPGDRQQPREVAVVLVEGQ